VTTLESEPSLSFTSRPRLVVNVAAFMSHSASVSESESEDDLFYHKGQLNAQWSDDEPGAAFARGRSRSDSSDDGLALRRGDGGGKKRLKSPIISKNILKSPANDSHEREAHEETRKKTDAGEDDDERLTRGAKHTTSSSQNKAQADTISRARTRALFVAVDGLARPPSPVFLSPAAKMEAEASDSDSVRQVGDAFGYKDEEVATVDPLDELDEGESITLFFQLPNGKKYERKVEKESTFSSIMRDWNASEDWDEVVKILGSASVVLIFDGDVVHPTQTPKDLDLEDEDTVDVTAGKKVLEAADTLGRGGRKR